MYTKPNGKTGWLTVTSLILGIFSFVLVVLPFLIVPGVIFGEHDAFTDYLFGRRGLRFWPASLIFSLTGCIFAVIARKKEVDKRNTKIAIIMVLNGLLFIIALSLFLFTPILSYPHPQTIPNNLLP